MYGSGELTNDIRNMHLSKKPYSERCNFLIQHGSGSFELPISSESSVMDLHQAVAQRISLSTGNRFVCLQSSNKNELIDYVLSRGNERLSIFRKNQIFRTYCTNYLEQDVRPCLSDFIFMKCLGQGGSASVYLVRRKKNGQLYALKQVDKDYFIEFKRMEQILREKKILSEVVSDFPFVSLLHASFESERHLNFLLEYYPGGELFLHLQRRRFNEHEAKLYFCEIVMAFEHLHKNRIIYRDLKPENIMVDWQGHARLTDFGLCKMNLTREEFTHSFCGSLEYMAPELKENQGYNYSVDFYTLGAFLYEMVVGVPPYYNNQPLFFPDKASKGFIELVKGLIDRDLEKRIDSFMVIKSSGWLAGVNWADIFDKRYEMPIKLCIYDSYVHEEFVKVKVDSMNLMGQEKFDRLFDLFYYNRDDRRSNHMDAAGRHQKLFATDAFKKSKTKNKSRKSSKEKDRDSQHSKSKTRKSTSRDRSTQTQPKKSKPIRPQFGLVPTHSHPVLEVPRHLPPRVYSPVALRDPSSKKFTFRN